MFLLNQSRLLVLTGKREHSPLHRSQLYVCEKPTDVRPDGKSQFPNGRQYYPAWIPEGGSGFHPLHPFFWKLHRMFSEIAVQAHHTCILLSVFPLTGSHILQVFCAFWLHHADQEDCLF